MSLTSFRVNPHSIVCQNVKKLLARSRRHIWNLSDSNGIRRDDHVVRKQTPNHLSKLANDWAVLWVLICTVHLTVCCYHVTCKFQSESTLSILSECQETPCSKQAPYLKFKWQQQDSNRARGSLTFRQTIKCRVTLKLVRVIIITYIQMHCIDKYSQHSSIIGQFG